jgi:Ca2+-transporting ATPase
MTSIKESKTGSGMKSEENHLAWFSKRINEVLELLETGERGLNSPEIAIRKQKYGPNSLPQTPPPTIWQILFRQFQNPLIYILIAAALFAVVAGDFKDASFIAAVLAVNSLIGGYQEWSAEKSSRALQKLLHIRATVTRDGDVCEVDAEELVPGDIVWLESGNRVPADLRLISAQGLDVDESLLTGESLAVHKDANWLGEATVPVSDRRNMAHAASIIVRGRAKGVVAETGTQTAVGQLAVDVLRSDEGTPPLMRRMEQFSRVVAYAVLVAVAIVALMGIFIHGYSLKEMFLFSVALAVSAIPEGLPAALTVALAVATTRMAKRGVIVRRLAAVEGLGSCTMIASDKTGTLTCNELTVRSIWLPDGTTLTVTGEGFVPNGNVMHDGKAIERLNDESNEHRALKSIVQASMLCNEGDLHNNHSQWSWHGDPTDIALLSVGHKVGMERPQLVESFPQVGEIPFEPEHQFAATFHNTQSEQRVFVKGAPERVLGMCRFEAAQVKDQMLTVAEGLAAEGYRVLAIAEGPVATNVRSGDAPPHPTDLLMLGFVGMIDPLRPDVRQAVESCKDAGVRVCMVTGDHPVTALAISRDLGLATEANQVVTGTSLAKMSHEELRAVIGKARVFARVAPRQKLELVEAAQAEGHFVAVTGDGVNDAPALRAANIGVAMGKSGTDVAREAAELVISDDNFASIIVGVEEGRIAYDNIRKVIYLLFSTGAAEVLLIGFAFAVGTTLPLPLLPVQLLWLNLVTNGIQGVALAFEPGEEGVLRRKPRRPSEPVFDRLMIERTVVAACVMAGVGVAAFWWMIDRGETEQAARNALLLLMVLFENVHIGNCRSETRSGLTRSPFRSPILLLGAIGALLIHMIGMHVPFLQSVLQTTPVDLKTWAGLIGLSLTVFIAIELHKWSWYLRYR